MAPDVRFHLTHEAYDRLSELLAPHGITVRETARDVHKSSETQKAVIESSSGFLIYQGREFAFRRQKIYPDPSVQPDSFDKSSSSPCLFRDGSLWVCLPKRDLTGFEQLFDYLEGIFPNPPPPQPSPQAIRKQARLRLIGRFGCIIASVSFGALCVLLFYVLMAYFGTER